MGPPTAYAAGPSIQRVKSRHSAVSYDGVRYSSLTVGRDAKRCPFGTVMSGSLCVWCFSIFHPSQRISAESAEPVGLVILAGSNPLPNPQCSSPSRRPDSHAATVVEIVRELEHLCKRRSDRSLSARASVRPPPAAPIGLPARTFGQSEVVAGATTSARPKAPSLT